MNTLNLDSFTRAYLACALWSSLDGDEPPNALDANYSIDDISPALLAESIEDCEAFRRDNAEALEQSGLSTEQQGHDFWLTRNRHGAGFWDRGLSVPLSDILTTASHVYGSVDLYVHDGLIYG